MDLLQNEINNKLKTGACNKLDRKKHIEKLIQGLTGQLPKHYEVLVPGQTWAVYWITHSLALLEQPNFLDTVIEDVIEFIKQCEHPDGGYGGGPGQIAHLATTFAAVNALITIHSDEALESIDRASLIRFLHKMKQSDGSFTMHEDGEIDSRATYCALAVLRCLNIQDPILLQNVADWILTCQTYEGGFGSVPDSEAHGGYTFCCVASLCLLNQLQRANLPSLLRWLTNKQMTNEGGFCGRSNKLVDSCYSYWQGSVFPLLHPFLKDSSQCFSFTSTSSSSETSEEELESQHKQSPSNCHNTRSSARLKNNLNNQKKQRALIDKHLDNWIFDCGALQDYVLNHCQAETGLLTDKPEVPPDFYHTCYALSGLSISQHQPDDTLYDIGAQQINLLDQTHPLFNLTMSSLNHCFDYFRNKKIETYEEDKNKQDPN